MSEEFKPVSFEDLGDLTEEEMELIAQGAREFLTLPEDDEETLSDI